MTWRTPGGHERYRGGRVRDGRSSGSCYLARCHGIKQRCRALEVTLIGQRLSNVAAENADQVNSDTPVGELEAGTGGLLDVLGRGAREQQDVCVFDRDHHLRDRVGGGRGDLDRLLRTCHGTGWPPATRSYHANWIWVRRCHDGSPRVSRRSTARAMDELGLGEPAGRAQVVRLHLESDRATLPREGPLVDGHSICHHRQCSRQVHGSEAYGEAPKQFCCFQAVEARQPRDGLRAQDASLFPVARPRTSSSRAATYDSGQGQAI